MTHYKHEVRFVIGIIRTFFLTLASHKAERSSNIACRFGMPAYRGTDALAGSHGNDGGGCLDASKPARSWPGVKPGCTPPRNANDSS